MPMSVRRLYQYNCLEKVKIMSTSFAVDVIRMWYGSSKTIALICELSKLFFHGKTNKCSRRVFEPQIMVWSAFSKRLTC